MCLLCSFAIECGGFMACLLLLTSVDIPAVGRAAADTADRRLDYDLQVFIHLEWCSIQSKSSRLFILERSRHSDDWSRSTLHRIA